MTTLTPTELLTRSLACLPAGSNGEFNVPEPLARVIVSGRGCLLRDEAGRELLDFSMGWGSVLPGHARHELVEAVSIAARSGTNFSYPSASMVRLAGRLVDLLPAVERVRFCASGTEATMHCLRLARAAMDRPLVLKFEGAYHGSNDEGVTSLFPSGSAPFPRPEPSSAGIQTANTLVAPYNDLDATRAIVRAHASSLACIIVEPLQRCWPPRPGFLEGLRALCDETRVLLVFDEVVTGFRLALRGAQEKYGVIPDLAAYGKALGGGMPLGAFGGRAEIMDLVREDGMGTRPDYVWTASTLGGNPVSSAAACAALDLYEHPETYRILDTLGAQFRQMLARTLRDAGETAQVLGDGPLAQIAFSPDPIVDYRSAAKADRARARRLMLELWRRDIFLNPMGTKLYLSLAHTQDDCAAFCERLASALRDLA